MAAAEIYGVCPFEVMDHIWFHQIIIFSANSLFPISTSVTDCSQSEVEESKCQERDYFQQTTYTADLDRPARLNLISRRTSSHPSSPKSTKKRSTNLDLHHQLEEVKGFMDLGFDFKKENLSNHLISLIPGLQRVSAYYNDCDEDKQKKRKMMRPYLSEVLLDYPSRMCKDSDEVKKHLKNWARTVAAAIHQESYS